MLSNYRKPFVTRERFVDQKVYHELWDRSKNLVNPVTGNAFKRYGNFEDHTTHTAFTLHVEP